MDRDTIRNLVVDEVARPEIQSALRKSPETLLGQLGEVFRHPMVLTIVGFLLTATVGTYLENRISASADERAEREAQVDAILAQERRAQDSLLALTRLAHERSVRANLLRSAIRRDAASLVRRKKEYDDAYVAWNVQLNGHLLELRKDFARRPEDMLYPMHYENMVNSHIGSSSGAFAISDACLTAAFDARVAARASNAAFEVPACDGASDWHDFSKQAVRRASLCVETILEDGMRYARELARDKVAELRGGARLEIEIPAQNINLRKNCVKPS